MHLERELLTKLRGRLAYKSGCEPYVIFNNVALEEILKIRPKSLEELSTIKGFPSDGKRIKNWGQAIIDIFIRGNEIEDFDVKGEGEELIVSTTLKKMTIF